MPISATAELLLDEDGTSRWMTSKRAKAAREAKGFEDGREGAYMQAYAAGELS